MYTSMHLVVLGENDFQVIMFSIHVATCFSACMISYCVWHWD